MENCSKLHKPSSVQINAASLTQCRLHCRQGEVFDTRTFVCTKCSTPLVEDNVCVGHCSAGRVVLDGVCLEQCPPGHQMNGDSCGAGGCVSGSPQGANNISCSSQCPVGYFISGATCLKACPTFYNLTHCMADCGQYAYDSYYCASACKPGSVNQDGRCVNSAPFCKENQTISFEFRICVSCQGLKKYFDRQTKLCVASCVYMTYESNICEVPGSQQCMFIKGFGEQPPYKCALGCTSYYPMLYQVDNNAINYCVENCQIVSQIVKKSSNQSHMFISSTVFRGVSFKTCVADCPSGFFTYLDVYYQSHTKSQCLDSCGNLTRFEYDVLNGRMYVHCMASCWESEQDQEFSYSVDTASYKANQCVPSCERSAPNMVCYADESCLSSQPYLYMENNTYRPSSSIMINIQTPICY